VISGDKRDGKPMPPQYSREQPSVWRQLTSAEAGLHSNRTDRSRTADATNAGQIAG
jgi:hypothetical protein